jgi:hypothetical protein
MSKLIYTLVKFKLQNKVTFKIYTKIYILPCAHISFKINMSLIQTLVPQFENPWLNEMHSVLCGSTRKTLWAFLIFVIVIK